MRNTNLTAFILRRRIRLGTGRLTENPNLICLKSSGNTLSFDRVKSIEVDTDASILGTVITIFCGDFNTAEHDITYKLVVA